MTKATEAPKRIFFRLKKNAIKVTPVRDIVLIQQRNVGMNYYYMNLILLFVHNN